MQPAGEPKTEHFSLSEFTSGDGELVPEEYWKNIQRLMNNLEILRASLGGSPVIINSGYRSPQHNMNVGGSPNSQHLKGKAADIIIRNFTPEEVYDEINALMDLGMMDLGGVGIYDWGIHYDIRGTFTTWDLRTG